MIRASSLLEEIPLGRSLSKFSQCVTLGSGAHTHNNGILPQHFSSKEARVGALGALAAQLTGLLEVVETIQAKDAARSSLLVDALGNILRVAQDCGIYMLEYGQRSTFRKQYALFYCLMLM
jgi:hypothetical protein